RGGEPPATSDTPTGPRRDRTMDERIGHPSAGRARTVPRALATRVSGRACAPFPVDEVDLSPASRQSTVLVCVRAPPSATVQVQRTQARIAWNGAHEADAAAVDK